LKEHRNMAAWRRTLARSAWAAFLVLFAARAIAGMAVCEFYGGFGAPTGAQHANEFRSHAQQRTDERALPAEQPSHDGGDIACEEPVYLSALSGQPLVLSSVKCSLTSDAIAWSYAPARDQMTAASAKRVWSRQPARPPPSFSPLDLSPRLRI